MATISSYGRWASPLEAGEVAKGRISLSELCSDGSSLYWLESRPNEGGRVVFVRADGDTVVDVSPVEVSIRSRVNEYGGGAVCLVPGQRGAFAYVALDDQRVWHVASDGAAAVALSSAPPAGERWNHGGLSSSADGQWVLAVREIHGSSDPGVDPGASLSRPHRQVVAFGTRPENSGESILADGHDFFGSPKLCPTGSRLAVTAWDHPDMPWDGSSLVVVPVTPRHANGAGRQDRLVPTAPPYVVAGSSEESVGQPTWTRTGGLLFVSDRAGWWQPHRHSGDPDGREATALTDAAAEFHTGDFVLGLATMAERSDGSIGACMASGGRDSLVLLRPGRPADPPQTVAQPCVNISAVCAHDDDVALIGATPYGPAAVFTVSLGTGQPPHIWGRPRPSALEPDDVSVGEPFTLVGSGGREVHGNFFAPTRRDIRGPDDQLPPLIVHCHGGPTAAASAAFDVTMQYFTSRGFAVALVDYAGSTGYGRAYRCSLWGQWGVADSEDCLSAARHVAAERLVDAGRMAIRGGSAGGLTALNALTAPDGFAAAVSWYGVTDLLGLAATTHDFEAHYTDRLIGPLPEYRRTYEARSPRNRAGELHGSVLLFQGLDDLVVPPSQAESLRDALLSAGSHCEVHFFEGEGHGFRRAETIQACLEAELDFYLRQLDL